MSDDRASGAPFGAPDARPDRTLVQLLGVSKTFITASRQEVRALAPVDLTISEGEFVAIVGPSGCGKSTMLALMAGLEVPTSGSVIVGGSEVHGPVTDIGVVFQKDLLLTWRNVLQNVMIQAEVRGLDIQATRDRAVELLDRVGLGGFEGQMPAELSGGMRQRVSICRALIHDPALLLMDEPFASLDALTRDQLALDFQALGDTQAKTILFITHSVPEAVFLADTVYVMSPRPGRLAERLVIDLPRPRHLSVREEPEFARYVRRITEVFQQEGVLRDS